MRSRGGALEKDTPAGKRKGEMAAAADQDTSTGASGKKPKTWFDWDSAIADALRSHQTWLRKTKISLEDAVSTAQGVLDSVPFKMKEDVKNEARLCKNRVYALKLVLGTSTEDSVSEKAEQKKDKDAKEAVKEKKGEDGNGAEGENSVDGKKAEEEKDDDAKRAEKEKRADGPGAGEAKGDDAKPAEKTKKSDDGNGAEGEKNDLEDEQKKEKDAKEAEDKQDKVAPDEAHDEERSLLCPTMRRRRDKKNTHERNKQNKQNKNKQKTNKNKTNEQRKKQRNRKKGRESVKTTNQKNKKIKNIKCSPRFPVEGNHVTQYTQFLIILFHYTQQQQKKETHYSVPSIHKSNL